MDDLVPLAHSDHWLGWLGDDPQLRVRHEIESMLQKQVPTATLAWVRLLGTPEFLTGGREVAHVPSKILATRAALAVAFELEVVSADRQDELNCR